MNRIIPLITLLAIPLATPLIPQSAFAQSSRQATPDAAKVAKGSQKEDKKEAQDPDSNEEDDSDSDSGTQELKLRSPFEPTPDETTSDDTDQELVEQVEEEVVEQEAPPQTAPEVVESASVTTSNDGFSESVSFSGGFEPLKDVEEGALEQILPGAVHPRIDFKGYMRARTDMQVNYDLDTDGTSAILPVFDSIGAIPAEEGKAVAISSNMRFHIEPTLVITDELSIHSEFDILDNLVLGDSPVRLIPPNPSAPGFPPLIASSAQFNVADAIKIRELYGQVDSLFGSLYVGRMDTHFGLGIQDNSGDCIDCNFGSNVDRLKLETSIFGFTVSASVDLPDEGITTQTYKGANGQAYDLSQVDDVDQYTFQISYIPRTKEEKLLQLRKLQHDGLPVHNAALLFRWRQQDGSFTSTPATTSNYPNTLPTLIYKGMQTFTLDAWYKLLYNPNDDLSIRLELETFVNFGSIANISEQPVGQATPTKEAVNCFQGDVKDDRCSTALDGSSLARDFVQWAVALETEFKTGKIASFGLNTGIASGGSTLNWGLPNPYPDYNFARFNPDYHIDLILFRNVIGTITNAAYFKPYVHLEFLKNGPRHLEGDIAAILSLAVDPEGTPSGERLLGAEFDGAVRYILKDQLSAGLEAGVLFPLAGLKAVAGRRRLQRFDSKSADFTENRDPSIAWTLQGKIVWQF